MNGEILESFADVNALVIGDLILDRYKWGSVSRVSPEAPVPVVDLERTNEKLGGAGNAAQAMAEMDASITLVGRLGKDEPAKIFQQILRDRDIEWFDILVDSEAPTTVKTRIIAQNQHLVRLDEEDRNSVPVEVLRENKDEIEETLDDHDVVLLSDYGKGVFGSETLDWWIRKIHEAGLPIVVDPFIDHFMLYDRAELMTPNESELRDALGDHGPGSKSLERLAMRCIEETNLSGLLVTRGEKGMVLFRQGKEPRHLGTNARDVYDVTGAGDTVAALMTLGESTDYDRSEVMPVANAAAGAVVERMGTAAVGRDEIEEFLDQ